MKLNYLLSNSFRIQTVLMPIYMLFILMVNYVLSSGVSLRSQLINFGFLVIVFNIMVPINHYVVEYYNRWKKMLLMSFLAITALLLLLWPLYWLAPDSKAFVYIDGKPNLTLIAIVRVLNRCFGIMIMAGLIYYLLRSKHQQAELLKASEEAHQKELEMKEVLHRKELENQVVLHQKELEVKDLENVFLATQIPPHFLHNTLVAMVEESIVGNPSLAKQLLNLSELMRYKVFCSLKENRIVLEDKEEQALQKYLAIMQWRYPDMRLVYTMEGDVGGQRMLPTAVLALVENMFKHGLFRNGQYPICIHRILEKDYVAYRLTNKIDPQSQEPKEQGVGLQNVKRRLELLFSNSYQLDTTVDVDNNFTVYFKINQ